MKELQLWLRRNNGVLLAVGVFIAMFGFYNFNHSAGFSVNVLTTAANKGVLLALVAMAQTVPVLTGGLDLSVGMMFILSNCVASWLVVGTLPEIALGVIAVLGVGLAGGFINGTIVVFGRLQPIITTLATGAIYYGFALRLRPVPGGDVDGDLGDFMTGQIFDVIPVSILLLLFVVLVIWIPFRRSEIGRGCYAAGSAEGAAYMSGVKLGRSKLAAYVLSGFLAAVAGLLLTFITSSGEASAPSGGNYTLNSIAAVVIGGTSLFGGSGTAIGSIFGAFVLRTISDLLFVFDLPPLWQPLFEGVVLLLAVSLGAVRILRIRNRLEQFG